MLTEKQKRFKEMTPQLIEIEQRIEVISGTVMEEMKKMSEFSEQIKTHKPKYQLRPYQIYELEIMKQSKLIQGWNKLIYPGKDTTKLQFIEIVKEVECYLDSFKIDLPLSKFRYCKSDDRRFIRSVRRQFRKEAISNMFTCYTFYTRACRKAGCSPKESIEKFYQYLLSTFHFTN
jgi:hypothetical protein